MLSGGIIKQVLITTVFGDISTGSSSYVTASTLSLTITPASASSRFFVNVGGGQFNGSCQLTIFRNATNLSSTNDNSFIRQNDNTSRCTAIASVLDSPNTSSAVTYSVQFKNGNFNTSSLGTLLVMEAT